MPRFLLKACVLALCVVGCDLRPAKAPTEETSAPEEAKVVDRQTTLSGTREYAIELLENGQYAALAINVIDISMLERMAATHPSDNVIEGAIEDFASSSEPTALLSQLRDSRTLTPTISGDVARFDDAGIVFERINGRWYLK